GTAAKPGGGSWAVLSDAREKHDINQLEGSLDRLMRLRGVTFYYNNPNAAGAGPGLRTGMIAQEVQEVFPEWATPRHDGTLMLNINGFEAVAIEAIKQLKTENDQLKARLAKVDAMLGVHGRAK